MTSVSVNVPSSVTMVNVPSSFFRDCARVDFSQGEDEYGRGIPIRLMVDERHLRCLVEVQGDKIISETSSDGPSLLSSYDDVFTISVLFCGLFQSDFMLLSQLDTRFQMVLPDSRPVRRCAVLQ